MTDPGDRLRSKTETFEIAISGLLTKRADTLGELLRLRERMTELEGDILALDRVLGTMGYADELEAVPPRQSREAPFGRGQVMRAILDYMRAAGGPVTARQIAEGAFADLVSERDDAVPLDSLARRVSKSLGRLKRDGTIKGAPDGRGTVRWSLVYV